MNRKSIINIHLFLASFFAPVLLMIGLSGGLYLLDIKGSVESTEVYQGTASEVNMQPEDRDEEMARLLTAAGIEHSFDYTRGSDSAIITRPTSGTHYLAEVEGNRLTITRREPSFIRTIIELHKGHGPTVFKWFQKFVALGLLLILLSGLLLGLTSPVLRKKTWLISGLGLVVTFGLIML